MNVDTSTGSSSEQVLEKIRQVRQSREVVDVNQETTKVVIFELSGVSYAVYGCHVREIIQQCQIAWLPGLPAHLPGLVNIRGDIESVVDLKQLLGIEQGKDRQTQMLVMVADGSFRTGLLVDQVHDVLDLLVSSIKAPLSSLNGNARELVSGEFDYRDDLVALLDIARLAAKVRL
jgi:purine-binding chemotaxis protein CheW